MTGTDQSAYVRDDRYLSIREVAEQLDVVYLTARSYIQKGHIRATLMGTRYRVTQAEVDRFKRYGNYPAGLSLTEINAMEQSTDTPADENFNDDEPSEETSDGGWEFQ